MAAEPTAAKRTDYRVRRAKDKTEFLAKLTESGTGPFQTMRDAIGFAAALGYFLGKRESFDGTDEPIAWSTFTNKANQEQLVEMIAAATIDDPEILGDDRLEERIRILEEYANAGLSALQQMTAGIPMVDALTNLILQQSQPGDQSIDTILDELSKL